MACLARSYGAPLAGALLTLGLVGLTGLGLVGLVAAPASADDPRPPGTQSTPSVSPPSQQQIDDAKAALDRLRHGRTKSPTKSPPKTQLAEVAGPTVAPGHRGVRISDQGWWTIGSGLLVLLVASETTRVRVRRAKHRKGT